MFFFPDGIGIIKDGIDSGFIFIRFKLCKIGPGSMMHHYHTWIGHHRVQNPTENVWGVLEKTCTSQVLYWWRESWNTAQDLGENIMQIWKKINVVTLHKLIKMMPLRMCAIIKRHSNETFVTFLYTHTHTHSTITIVTTWHWYHNHYTIQFPKKYLLRVFFLLFKSNMFNL